MQLAIGRKVGSRLNGNVASHVCPFPYQVSTKDENIGNHGYIGTSILRIYWIYQRYIGYIRDILTDILEKNIDKPKIDQNL